MVKALLVQKYHIELLKNIWYILLVFCIAYVMYSIFHST